MKAKLAKQGSTYNPAKFWYAHKVKLAEEKSRKRSKRKSLHITGIRKRPRLQTESAPGQSTAPEEWKSQAPSYTYKLALTIFKVATDPKAYLEMKFNV